MPAQMRPGTPHGVDSPDLGARADGQPVPGDHRGVHPGARDGQGQGQRGRLPRRLGSVPDRGLHRRLPGGFVARHPAGRRPDRGAHRRDPGGMCAAGCGRSSVAMSHRRLRDRRGVGVRTAGRSPEPPDSARRSAGRRPQAAVGDHDGRGDRGGAPPRTARRHPHRVRVLHGRLHRQRRADVLLLHAASRRGAGVPGRPSQPGERLRAGPDSGRGDGGRSLPRARRPVRPEVS